MTRKQISISTVAFALFFTPAIYASDTGKHIYEKHCQACHTMKMPMNKTAMISMSKTERMAMKEKMMRTMKAPPMAKISAKLKHDFHNDKKAVVAFVEDYIANPSADKSHCMPHALKRFGVMPPIGKGLKSEERKAVAEWLYDAFDTVWDPKTMGMTGMTEAKDSSRMPSKAGMKCGGMMKAAGKMKCAAGKCGMGR